jgi:hypothetical protein
LLLACRPKIEFEVIVARPFSGIIPMLRQHVVVGSQFELESGMARCYQVMIHFAIGGPHVTGCALLRADTKVFRVLHANGLSARQRPFALIVRLAPMFGGAVTRFATDRLALDDFGDGVDVGRRMALQTILVAGAGLIDT